MRDADRLRRALRLVDREERLRPDAGWHPSPAELTAYRNRLLPPRRAARVQRHLGTCLDCPDLLLDLERFLAMPQGVEEDGDAAWEDLRPRLFHSVPPEPDSRPWALPTVILSVRTAYAVAATSLLAAVALALWSSFPRPQANVALATVAMSGTYRSAGRVSEITVPAGAERVVLTLVTEFEEGSELQLDILDGDEHPLRSIPGLRVREGEVYVSLPRSHLPPGLLQLSLRAGGSPESAEIQVLHP